MKVENHLSIDKSVVFNVDGKPSFVLPISEISNATVSAKNEVTLETLLSMDPAEKKRDGLVDVRFFVPPSNGDSGSDSENEEKMDAANVPPCLTIM